MSARCTVCYGTIENGRLTFHPRCHDLYRKHYKRLRLVQMREVNRSLYEDEMQALRKRALTLATDDYASSSGS